MSLLSTTHGGVIVKSDKNRYACRACGQERTVEDGLTARGNHIECGVELATFHFVEMRDPNSVTRKYWEMAERYSWGGRPKNYTVPRGTMLNRLSTDVKVAETATKVLTSMPWATSP